MAKTTLGGGCFWCLDATFNKLKGVNSVISGYADGAIDHPTYEQICTGTTGHAEVVQIDYDVDIIDFQTLLHIFFNIHDPTTVNRQGADTGTQYRSIILAHNNEQLNQAKDFITQLEQDKIWPAPIATQVKPLKIFYEAEEYHQNYFQINPNSAYCQAVISPKVAKLQHDYASLLKI